MTTATTASGRRERRGDRLRAVLAARAVVAAALACIITFTVKHDAPFGLLVLGVFELVQAAVLLAGIAVVARGRLGRGLLGLRTGLLALVGVLALVLPGAVAGHSLTVVLVALEVAAFVVGGLLELLAGLKGVDRAAPPRDAVTMGGLQLVAAAMLAVMNPDPVLAIGVQGAWGAIVAVYLGIAAASVGRGRTA